MGKGRILELTWEPGVIPYKKWGTITTAHNCKAFYSFTKCTCFHDFITTLRGDYYQYPIFWKLLLDERFNNLGVNPPAVEMNSGMEGLPTPGLEHCLLCQSCPVALQRGRELGLGWGGHSAFYRMLAEPWRCGQWAWGAWERKSRSPTRNLVSDFTVKGLNSKLWSWILCFRQYCCEYGTDEQIGLLPAGSCLVTNQFVSA